MQATIFITIVTLIVNIECKMEPFIVGGTDAETNQFPYIAFLGVMCVSDNEVIRSYLCGSSIINQQILMTAAHCLFGFDWTLKVLVTVGHKQKYQGDMQTTSKFVLHEEYDDKLMANDIALVFVERPINLTSRVQRVALMENPPYDDEAMVAGWGVINEDTNAEPNVLQYTKQYVLRKSKCVKHLNSIPENTLCARSEDTFSFAARGDSGGPLVVRGYIQIGIVSYKLPKQSIVVYTDVGRHYEWIDSNIYAILCH